MSELRKKDERDLWFSAALFLLALLPRLYIALAWPREPVWDGHYYDFGARRIAAGFGYSDESMIGGLPTWHPWCHYPVGYSGFLAIFYSIFGAGPRVGPIVNALIGALTAVLVHRLARTALSPTRAQIAGALTAVNPGLIIYTALLMTEPLAGFGLLLAAWLFVRDRERPLRAGLLAGLVLGLSTLVRPPSLLLAPALIFFTCKGSGPRPWLRRLTGPAVALAMAMLTVLPWTLRNCRVMDGCAFVSTNAGWNLMIGAMPRATGRFETVRATDGCPVVTGQVQQDRCWGDAGLAHIAADPLRWLSLAPKKLAFTFDHESFPVGYLAEANPTDWPESRRERARGLLGGAHRLLLAIAALAAVPRPTLRRGRAGEGKRRLLSWIPLILVVGLTCHGFAADTHPFWPLALALVSFAAMAAIGPVSAMKSPAPASLPEASPADGGRRGQGLIVYLACVVASVALVSVVFFGEDRYHMVATPALCLLAACALRRPSEPSAAAS